MQHSGRGKLLIAVAVATMFAAGAGARSNPQRGGNSGKLQAASQEPIYFARTSGLDTNPILYSARGAAYDVFVSREETDVVLHGGLEQSKEAERGKLIVVRASASVLRMRFVGADLPVSVQPIRLSPRNRNSFAAVVYRGIFAGTDVILSGNQQQIGFQVRLSPGAEAQGIVLELSGATLITLNAAGDAVVHAGRESLVLKRPTLPLASQPEAVGAYRVESGNRLRFILSAITARDRQTVTD